MNHKLKNALSYIESVLVYSFWATCVIVFTFQIFVAHVYGGDIVRIDYNYYGEGTIEFTYFMLMSVLSVHKYAVLYKKSRQTVSSVPSIA